jgi:hypothetical protein
MWPFKPQEPESPLRERVADLERELRGLKLDYTELYDRVRSALGKISKRAALIERHEATSEETSQEPQGGPNGVGSVSDPFSESVRALRRHGSSGRAK